MVSVPWGFPLVLAFKSIIDTAWASPLIGEFKLTECFSVSVTVLILIRLFLTPEGQREFRRMPLKWVWVAYIVDLLIFSAIAIFVEGPLIALTMFFRHINGFIGFFVAQGYFSEERRTKRFLLALAAAGIFPMVVGLLEIGGVISVQWTQTEKAGLARHIGFYHDAITPRYYAEQTILVLFLYSALYFKRIRQLANKLAALCLAIGSLIVMYKTYSKSGLATLFMWTLQWTILQRKISMLIVLSVIGTVTLGYYSDSILDETYLIFHEEIGAVGGEVGIERTFTGRWYIWDPLIHKWDALHFLARIFGSGHLANGAHNDYIQILYHGGVLGLVIYLVLLGSTATKIFELLLRGADPLSVAALMALTMWFIDSIGLVPSTFSGYQWFVWGIIGLALRVGRDRQFGKSQAKGA